MPVNGPTQTGADQRSGPSPQPRLPEHRLSLKEVLDELVADGLVAGPMSNGSARSPGRNAANCIPWW